MATCYPEEKLIAAVERTRELLVELAGTVDAIDHQVYEEAIADLMLSDIAKRDREEREKVQRTAAGAAVLYFAGELVRGAEHRFAAFDQSTMRWLDRLDSATPRSFELRFLALNKLSPLRAALGEAIDSARALGPRVT